MRRAPRDARARASSGVAVDGDDRIRAGEAQRGDDLQADAAAADDGRRVAALHRGDVPHRAARR